MPEKHLKIVFVLMISPKCFSGCAVAKLYRCMTPKVKQEGERVLRKDLTRPLFLCYPLHFSAD